MWWEDTPCGRSRDMCGEECFDSERKRANDFVHFLVFSYIIVNY